MASNYESVVSKHQALVDIQAFSLLLYRIVERELRVLMRAMRDVSLNTCASLCASITSLH